MLKISPLTLWASLPTPYLHTTSQGYWVLKATVKVHRSHTATRQEPKGCPFQLKTQSQGGERPYPRSVWFLGMSWGLGLLLLLCHPLPYRSVSDSMSILCPLNSPALPPPPPLPPELENCDQRLNTRKLEWGRLDKLGKCLLVSTALLREHQVTRSGLPDPRPCVL